MSKETTKEMNQFRSEKGLTLIEVLVSIVILTLVLVSFMTMFTQSAKTNQVSEEIISATYVAQMEMEEMYNKSTTGGLQQTMTDLQTTYPDGFEANPTEGKYKYEKESDGYLIRTRIKREPTDNRLVSVVVEVRSSTDTSKLEAKMETKLLWGN
ncbi:type IV pilus modification PilV family protein [Bacillus alkalicellulosilyticus]|uniref:type IV pilus modification PilV family protein n=1 Tax=Alkalihalobacterium alkalicellulosilyticum TaxID=1912214 RepID=UPI001FE7684F|nr:type II secretion system protein [Bacillus alkalicellulosilyticus]